jgi:uncharacterized protein YndB with AHSA1/START domain
VPPWRPSASPRRPAPPWHWPARRPSAGTGDAAAGPAGARPASRPRPGPGRPAERVEEPDVFAFTWPIYGLPDDDPRRTYVEFTLEPSGAGTRLTVVESGFGQLPEDVYRKAFDGNTEGWVKELGELAGYLDAA